jgi:hypothetical protein
MGTEKHTVSITFSFTFEGHKAIWEHLNIVFLDVWLSHKARKQLTQARSHCCLQQVGYMGREHS